MNVSWHPNIAWNILTLKNCHLCKIQIQPGTLYFYLPNLQLYVGFFMTVRILYQKTGPSVSLTRMMTHVHAYIDP